MFTVSPSDIAALVIWIITSVLSWISWGLLQNQRIIFDGKRAVALLVGITTTFATWCEFVLMRE